MTDSVTVTLDEYHGLPAWILRTPQAFAAISPHGGQLLAWQPHGGGEVFWLSDTSKRPPAAIRGGVPICWPYFGRQGQADDVPQHGIARLRTWRWVDLAEADHGDVVVDLVLPEDDTTPLRVRQRLRIGAQLSQTLITHNAGSTEVAFTQALHSYFAVTDAERARLSGVDGLRYEDKLTGGDHLQTGDWHLNEARDPGRCDRIYATRGESVLLHDEAGGRTLRVETEGSATLVVWNPGESGNAGIGDMPKDGWRGFVCVEVANAGADVVRLPPGAEHRLGQRLSLVPPPVRID